MELIRASERPYLDKMRFASLEEQEKATSISSTVYVGDIALYTSESQIRDLFGMCGPIKRVIMGLHRIDKQPCGFAFVEYFDRTAARAAEKCMSGLAFDGSVLKVDMDPGFLEGRQYGRARSGGQVKSERTIFRDQRDRATFRRNDRNDQFRPRPKFNPNFARDRKPNSPRRRFSNADSNQNLENTTKEKRARVESGSDSDSSVDARRKRRARNRSSSESS